MDGRFGRVAARCGLGGVLGAKNLKAVVVRGTRKPGVFDETGLKAVNNEVTTFLSRIKAGELCPFTLESREAIAIRYKLGCMGVKNQSRGRWEAFTTKFRETFKQGRHYHSSLSDRLP